MPRLFFLVSGEHETLPFAEVEAVLEAENIAYKKPEKLPQILRLETAVKTVKIVEKRAALTRICCQEILCCQASFAEIMKTLQHASLDSILCPGESFVVRVHRVGEATRNLASMDLERKIGELILRKVKGVKVNLKQPLKTFFGAITGNSFLLGLKLAEISPTPFMKRRPRNRPFFHPSAMLAKLARCMVNLATPRRGDLLLDPFCGTGSFLVEAGLIGCRAVGFDAKKHMVKGSMRNLKFFNIENDGVAVADARYLPLTKVDCIVTDPPYGRSASTMGYTTGQIIQNFLANVVDTIAKRQRICLAAPKTVNVAEMGETVGFKHVQSHFVYVHRSLTREIAVLERRV
ncbi:MAG: DNA methyltransferase [Candidatus Bathyarchaeia archaeon]